MKRITLTGLFLLLMGMGLGFSRSPLRQPDFNYHSHKQLGVEITTNSCKEILYFPVGMTKERALTATVPVESGGVVSAVRISPVMERGKVKFDVLLLSGNYAETISDDDLNRLLAVQVSTRVAAKGETLVVRDEISQTPWSVNIKAVDLREDSARAEETPQFLKVSSKQDPKDGCGCAYCHELRVCPTRGQCINTTCGSICCPHG